MDDILSRIASYAGVQQQVLLPAVPISVENKVETTGTDIVGHQKRVSTKIGLLCFSKNRPFQLEQLLLSIKRFLRPRKDDITIIILYSPGKLRSMYDGVFQRHPDVIPIEEVDTLGFEAVLLHCIEEILTVVGSDGFICFCVDDLIFIDKVDLSYYAHALAAESGSKILGFQLKLHPGIWYSHAAGKICYPPILVGYSSSFNADLHPSPALSGPPSAEENRGGVGHLQFELSGSTGDWQYALDLCAGLYRIKDIRYLLDRCHRVHGKESLRNPNILEVSLNNAFREVGRNPSKASKAPTLPNPSLDPEPNPPGSLEVPLPALLPQYTHSGCPCVPCLKVVTVNRVQSTYAVPTYSTAGGDLDSLNALCGGVEVKCNPQTLDLYRYLSDISLSVHVGALHLAPSTPDTECAVARGGGGGEGGVGGGVDTKIPSVCVLISVHNGEPYLAQCLHSLLTRPQHCSFEVLIVDDGSTDRGMDIAETVRLQAESGTFLNNPGATVRILRLERVGLPAALDKGLQATECEYIARLDCDDLCEGGRLGSQRDYLERHREVHVVGGQAVVIGEGPAKGASSSGCGAVQECGVLAGNYPTAPLLVHWAMFFRCSILHPSVMFRKSVIVQCGSYSNTGIGSGLSACPSCEHLIEDYSLWIRVLQRFPCSIANLPNVVIQLRKHRDSKSAVTGAALTAASDTLRWELVRNLLQSEDERALSGKSDCMHKASLCCLAHPQEHVVSPQAMHSAMVLLAALYKGFLHHIDASVQAEESLSGKKREKDCQEEIVQEVLLDTMRQIGKKVYRVGARAIKQALIPVPIPAKGSDLHSASASVLGPGEVGERIDRSMLTGAAKADSDRSWEALYSAEDLSYFKAVTALDIVHDLAAAYL